MLFLIREGVYILSTAFLYVVVAVARGTILCCTHGECRL